jgi:hypothetical protein
MDKQSVTNFEPDKDRSDSLPGFCVQRFGKYHTDLFRSIRFPAGKYTLAFGVYSWPWFSRCLFYNTTAGEIIDSFGVVNWLIQAKNTIRAGHRIFHFRILCIAIGLTWEVQP